jgi:DNA-binding NarL/FixJ family response regulator
MPDAATQGYILKGHSDELADAIRQLAQGEQYVIPALT